MSKVFNLVWILAIVALGWLLYSRYMLTSQLESVRRRLDDVKDVMSEAAREALGTPAEGEDAAEPSTQAEKERDALIKAFEGVGDAPAEQADDSGVDDETDKDAELQSLRRRVKSRIRTQMKAQRKRIWHTRSSQQKLSRKVPPPLPGKDGKVDSPRLADYELRCEEQERQKDQLKQDLLEQQQELDQLKHYLTEANDLSREELEKVASKLPQ